MVRKQEVKNHEHITIIMIQIRPSFGDNNNNIDGTHVVTTIL